MPNSAAAQFEVRCVDASHDAAALELSAQAWPTSEQAAYWQAVRALLAMGNAAQIVLLAATENGRLVAAQLAQIMPGRVALAWPPQFVDRTFEPRLGTAKALAALLTDELRGADVALAQALATPGDRMVEATLASGGFFHAADLLYLARSVADNSVAPSETPDSISPLEILPFSTSDVPRLIRLIDRTYVGTLDCPRLDGLRQTADVVSGYQAVGAFRPEFWQLARHDGQDVGCLLVNLHPDVGHAEIVYVAVTPEMRGRGLGKALVERAVRMAYAAAAQSVVLAVDAANAPAIAMYAELGFVEFDRRAVWILSLK